MARARALALTATAAAAALLSVASGQSDPSYDHQTTTYTAQFEPVTTSSKVSLTPFFSPEHSTDTLVGLIQAVAPGGSIDIATPGYSSWGSGDCSYGSSCIGCSISQMQQETFPIFPALLNAIHQKGAYVRIVTNDYGTPTCSGEIAPWDFLYLNGVNISYYASTTFMHAKYMRVQTSSGFVSAISSINYSNSSFLQNREAGLLVNESTPAGAQLAALARQVFVYDFINGVPYSVTNSYSSSQMAQIQSTQSYPVVVPMPAIPGSFITPKYAPISVTGSVETYTSPDYARDQLMNDLNSVTSSLAVYIYQITDTGITNELISLYNAGVNVTLLVSAKIYSYADSKAAKQCYDTLLNAGLSVRLSPTYYRYTHNKYWIVDGNKVRLNTGNWSPSDYGTSNSYPPYGNSGWQDINRDFVVMATSSELANVFTTVMNADYANGSDYSPYVDLLAKE